MSLFLNLQDINLDPLAVRSSEINAVCFDTPFGDFSGDIILFLKPGLANELKLPFNRHNVLALRDWCGCFSPNAFWSYFQPPAPPAGNP